MRLLPLAALLCVAAAPAEPPITLGKLRVQLFYEHSGKLSPDIAPPAKFDLWNVGAGEGSAAEPASDILVGVPLTMAGADMARFTDFPLTIRARTAAGKTLGTRTFAKGMILVPYHGATWARLWLNDVQCAGGVTFDATYGPQRRTTRLAFSCGE